MDNIDQNSSSAQITDAFEQGGWHALLNEEQTAEMQRWQKPGVIFDMQIVGSKMQLVARKDAWAFATSDTYRYPNDEAVPEMFDQAIDRMKQAPKAP